MYQKHRLGNLIIYLVSLPADSADAYSNAQIVSVTYLLVLAGDLISNRDNSILV
jgi:hypothetical protein